MSAPPQEYEGPKVIARSFISNLPHKKFYDGKLIALWNGEYFYLHSALDVYKWIPQAELEDALLRVLQSMPSFDN
jgi:hypothetical protein